MLAGAEHSDRLTPWARGSAIAERQADRTGVIVA